MADNQIAYVEASVKNLAVFQALASPTRLQIIELLHDQPRAIKDLSADLGISSAIVTRHIQSLEEAGIVESHMAKGDHGLRKMCRLKIHDLQVILSSNYGNDPKTEYADIDIPICAYSRFDVHAPCGMAMEDKLFGKLDDPRYFAAPNRNGLALLWFTSGYLEYPVPTYDIDFNRLSKIDISLELCSEFPGYNNAFESDIRFRLNGKELGTWTSPGDFGDRKGRYSPEWWNLGTEYGLLKTISIQDDGVFLDGVRLSTTPLQQFLENHEDSFLFRIECPENTQHPGGLNLFGKHFGDSDQAIRFRCYYKPESS